MKNHHFQWYKTDVNSNENGKLIGDKKYGYLTVPNSWVEFHDVDGNTSLQYSYAGNGF